jgi:transcriptional regulator with XRE-family HTH domain
MHFGSRRKELRESQNLSRYQLEKLTGFTQTHLKIMEETALNPRLDTICTLAEALGYSLPEFFSDKHTAFYLNEEEKELLTAFRRLDQTQQALVQSFAESLYIANQK